MLIGVMICSPLSKILGIGNTLESCSHTNQISVHHCCFRFLVAISLALVWGRRRQPPSLYKSQYIAGSCDTTILFIGWWCKANTTARGAPLRGTCCLCSTATTISNQSAVWIGLGRECQPPNRPTVEQSLIWNSKHNTVKVNFETANLFRTRSEMFSF